MRYYALQEAACAMHLRPSVRLFIAWKRNKLK